MIKKETLKQLIRYGMVGVFSNSFGYLLYLLLTYLGLTPKLTMTLLYAAGTVISFMGNKRWTFSHSGRWINAGVRFFLVYFAGYIINLILLYIFVDQLGYMHQIIQAIAIILVALFIFLSLKYFVFYKTILPPPTKT